MPKIRMFRFVFRLICAVALSVGAAAIPGTLMAQQPYHVIAHWKIGGGSDWDYLHIDPPTQRLYVSHGTKVEVLNARTGKIIGSIDGLKGCHGIAIDGTGKFGYISDRSGIVIFNTRTLAKVKTIPTKYGPDGIIYEPVTKTVWTFNGRGRQADVTAVDTTTQKLVATIPLTKDSLEGEAVDGKGHIFSNLGGDIVRIDAKTKQIDAQWKTGCKDGAALAYDTNKNYIFQSCHEQKVYVVDAGNGKVLGTSKIGVGPDGAGYSAKYHLAFVSTGDGYLTVVNANAPGYPVVEKLATEIGARTMTYDPTTDRIYTISAKRNPNVKMPSGPPGPPRGQRKGQGGPGRQGSGGPGGPRGHNRPSPFIAGTFNVVVIGR